ncbi:MAG: ABC transporter permease [Actinomycetota bacterium]|nr:ABC transporter permease [Actinomycetota bacterium]
MADRFPSSAGLLARQIGYQNRLFRRTAISAFFTLAFPLIFLLLFGAIFEDINVASGQVVAAAQFYAPGLAVFTAVSATYTNIGIVTAIYRDEGVLMRIRSTPLPRWVYMGGVVGSGVLIALFGSLIMLAVGFGLYGLEMEADRIPAAVVTFVVGVASFSLLGLALAAVTPSGQSAPAGGHPPNQPHRDNNKHIKKVTQHPPRGPYRPPLLTGTIGRPAAGWWRGPPPGPTARTA